MFTSSATALTAAIAASTRMAKNDFMRSSGSFQMTDGRVAPQARELAARRMRFDRIDDRLVAAAAGGLGDVAIARGDGDRLVEPSGGERERVPEPVQRFGGVFPDESR